MDGLKVMKINKRPILLVIAVFLQSCVFAGTYSGGTGEPNDPYLIATAYDLNDIGNHPEDFNKCFLMADDIDLGDYAGTEFNIIGRPPNSPFTGVFDGNDNKIRNFTWSSVNDYNVGLFAIVGAGGQIENLGLENVDVNVIDGYQVGGLVGCNFGTVTQCYSAGSVTGDSDIGGLVGCNYQGTITSCYSTGSITGYGDVGGLVGLNLGTVAQCCSTGSIAGDYKCVGGLVGHNGGYHYYGVITDCYSTAGVSGGFYVGGLVGQNHDNYSAITDSYSTGSVTGDGDIGGLVGVGLGVVEDCFWDIQTSGRTTSAGGVGKTTADMKIMDTFSQAGWDFIGETANGNDDIWTICEVENYPRFVWQIPIGDFVCPDGINFFDYSFFAANWGDVNCPDSNDCDGTDLDFSGEVGLPDLEIFCAGWLQDIQ